jgi:hypothetical protein
VDWQLPVERVKSEAGFLDSSCSPTQGSSLSRVSVVDNIIPMGMGQCFQHKAVSSPSGGAPTGLWLKGAAEDLCASPAHPD